MIKTNVFSCESLNLNNNISSNLNEQNIADQQNVSNGQINDADMDVDGNEYMQINQKDGGINSNVNFNNDVSLEALVMVIMDPNDKMTGSMVKFKKSADGKNWD